MKSERKHLQEQLRDKDSLGREAQNFLLVLPKAYLSSLGPAKGKSSSCFPFFFSQMIELFLISFPISPIFQQTPHQEAALMPNETWS